MPEQITSPAEVNKQLEKVLSGAVFNREAVSWSSQGNTRLAWKASPEFNQLLQSAYPDVQGTTPLITQDSLYRINERLSRFGLRARDESTSWDGLHQPLAGDITLTVTNPQVWERRRTEITPNPLRVPYHRERINASVSHEQSAPIDVYEPPGTSLRPYQKYAIKRGADQEGLLIADDPRLGKTAQAFGMINASQGQMNRVLIIAPGTAKGEWIDQSKQWLEHKLPIYEVETESGWNVPAKGPAMVVAHYASARPKKPGTPAHRDIFNRMRDEEWDFVVLDEAHFLKDPTSQQTLGVLGGHVTKPDGTIATIEPIRGKHRWALTGTPAVEKTPQAIYPLLRWLQPDVWGTSPEAERAFNQRYTMYEPSKRNPRQLNKTPIGAMNERELKELLLSNTMIRRQERIPAPIRHVERIVPSSQAEFKAIELARAAEQESAITEASRAGMTVNSYNSMIEAGGQKIPIPFKEMTNIAVQTAIAKAPTVAEYSAKIAKQEPVVIYTTFIEPVEVISRHLEREGIPHYALTGKKFEAEKARFGKGITDAEARRRMVKEFNSGNRQAIVSTIQGFSTGLSASRANRVIFGSPAWTTLDMRQAESRIKTTDKTEPIRIDTILLANSIDDNIIQKLHEKQGQESKIYGLSTGGQITRSREDAKALQDIETAIAPTVDRPWAEPQTEPNAPAAQQPMMAAEPTTLHPTVEEPDFEIEDIHADETTEDPTNLNPQEETLYMPPPVSEVQAAEGPEETPYMPPEVSPVPETSDLGDEPQLPTEVPTVREARTPAVVEPEVEIKEAAPYGPTTASHSDTGLPVGNVPPSELPDLSERGPDSPPAASQTEAEQAKGGYPTQEEETASRRETPRHETDHLAQRPEELEPVQVIGQTLPDDAEIDRLREQTRRGPGRDDDWAVPPPAEPLPPRIPTRADVDEPMYVGPISKENRVRAARDDCPIQDGDACITMMRPNDLLTDAPTFQYKDQTDSQGVSAKLQDVKKWDQDLAGLVYVWEKEDGARYVVDGHQRLALATRMQAQGQDPQLLVKFWREKDGYTPRYMRLLAAKKNIAEDSGTAVDAARVLIEEPELFDSLSQSASKVRDAHGLARLSKPVFNEAVELINANQLPENVAAVVSQASQNEDVQRGILHELAREQSRSHLTVDEATQLATITRRLMLDKDGEQMQQGFEGFDIEAVRESAWREREALTKGVMASFKNTRLVLKAVDRGDTKLERLGNVLARGANAEELTASQKSMAVLEVLSNSGPLADYLDQQAKQAKERMRRQGKTRRQAVAPYVTQAVDYLTPFLETYLDDNGATLRSDMIAKGFEVSQSDVIPPTSLSAPEPHRAPVAPERPETPDEPEITLFDAPVTAAEPLGVGSGPEEEDQPYVPPEDQMGFMDGLEEPEPELPAPKPIDDTGAEALRLFGDDDDELMPAAPKPPVVVTVRKRVRPRPEIPASVVDVAAPTPIVTKRPKVPVGAELPGIPVPTKAPKHELVKKRKSAKTPPHLEYKSGKSPRSSTSGRRVATPAEIRIFAKAASKAKR